MIGTHSGSYGVYRALAVAAGKLSRGHRADLTETAPADVIDPHPQWGEPEWIVCLDRLGATVADVFSAELAAGCDIRPNDRAVAELQQVENIATEEQEGT